VIASRLAAILRAEPTLRALGPRRALLVASSTLLLGLAMVGLRPADPADTTLIDIGMVVTLLSLILLIGAIHTYGRLGPDDGAASR